MRDFFHHSILYDSLNAVTLLPYMGWYDFKKCLCTYILDTIIKLLHEPSLENKAQIFAREYEPKMKISFQDYQWRTEMNIVWINAEVMIINIW